MTTKHTPTPWEVFDTLDSDDDDVLPVIELRHGNSYVATVNDMPDADHIVRCVNVHDELVAALRELSAACEYVAPIAGAVATKSTVKHLRNAGRFMAACAAARVALAKVEG